MAWLYRNFDVQAVLRPAGLLLLTIMLLLQAILPASASNSLQCHTRHQVEAEHAGDCTMHAAQPDDTAHVSSQTDDESGSAMHCGPSMCSVYVSFDVSTPAPVSTLLAKDLLAEGGPVLPLHLGTTQDRPPRNI
ncbi:hypothetical protein [Pelagivirga sediminicola]|uniref:hypothetical protein n=1 Tax=Pelagivirga sediminicola TaxID=2170575 RepID=UPI00105711FB|nr:hypothetical protein [Pelagivirga sediminicola]